MKIWLYSIVFAAAFLFSNGAAAVNLKHNAVLSENTIKLSDIFEGLPDGKDKILGPAPLPGKDMVLNARTLLRIAMALDLAWRPAHGGENIILSRAATVIDAGMVEDALMQAMDEKGVTGNYKIAFHGPLSEMILPLDQPAEVEVKTLTLQRDKNRFTATLVAPSKSNPIRSVNLSGALYHMIDVPVLKDTIRSGAVIGARDLNTITMRERDLEHDTILDEDSLIGMTPRRIAFAGKPLKDQDLQAPQIVGRGDFVTLNYAHKGMQLTAQGKALESGAKGDIIRVTNAATNKNLEARVTGQREVEIQSF